MLDTARQLLLLDRAPAMLAYWTRDLCLGLANRAYAAWLGTTPAALEGRSAVDVLGPDGFAQNEPYMRAALAGEPQRFERTRTNPAGETRHLEINYLPDRESGPDAGFFVFVLDVTDRRVAEETLRQENALLERRASERAADLQRADGERAAAEAERAAMAQAFESIVRAAPDGLLVVGPRGEILLANEEADRMFGLPPGALRGRGIEELVPAAVRDRHAAMRSVYDATPRARGMAFGRDLEARRADGTIFPAAISLGPVAFRGAPATLAIVRDVSERRALEASLRATEQRFFQAQKMDAIGRLASGVAHDFNNMLSVILSYAELALESLPAGTPLHSDLSEICAAGSRAAEITRQLLAFSRPEIGSARPIDVNDAIRRMTNMLRRAVGESVALRVDLGDDVGVVRADPGHLEQILLNLVVNARDAMPGGGSLLVRTRRLDAGDARGPSSPRGPLVELTVADSGVGMDEETRRHIFEPFFTTKAAGTGTGLGLATVYGIVRQGGGGIEVESAPGRGTTFTVLLPEDAADDAPDSASPAPASRRAGAVVLLAEDEEPLRRVIADVLARHGYTVLAAADGPEALARAAAYPGPIDVLLADVMMPRMSGRDLADALVTSRPETRVVFMSGHAADVVGQSGVAHGSTTLLQKPVTPAALAAKLRAVLRAPR